MAKVSIIEAIEVGEDFDEYSVYVFGEGSIEDLEALPDDVMVYVDQAYDPGRWVSRDEALRLVRAIAD